MTSWSMGALTVESSEASQLGFSWKTIISDYFLNIYLVGYLVLKLFLIRFLGLKLFLIRFLFFFDLFSACTSFSD